MDLPKILPVELERLSSIALRAVCHAYGSPPLAVNASFKSMLEFVRSKAQAPGAPPWRTIKLQFVLRLRGLGRAQMLEQHQVRIAMEAEQQRMAAEAARMAAVVAAVEADGSDDADDDDIHSFEQLSPGASCDCYAQFCLLTTFAAGTKIGIAAILSAQAAQRAAHLLAAVVQPSATQKVEAFLLDLKAGRNDNFDTVENFQQNPIFSALLACLRDPDW